MTDTLPRGGTAAAWLLAIRPATLTAAVAPVLVGTALAARDDAMRLGPAAAALAAALCIQVGTNLANDVDDFRRGADSAARLGPTRVVAAGLLPARQVRVAAWLAFGAAVVAGAYLVRAAGWPIAILGVAAIASGLAYTGGPWPLGYHGLGEVFVFAFFGVAAVAGTYYVQAGVVTPLAVAASVPVGALVTGILVVNNVRDRETDAAAGKRTLAVRLGHGAARAEFCALIGLAYAVPALMWMAGAASAWVLLPWLTGWWGVRLSRAVARGTDGPDFNAALRSAARLHGVFGALLAVGVLP